MSSTLMSENKVILDDSPNELLHFFRVPVSLVLGTNSKKQQFIFEDSFQAASEFGADILCANNEIREIVRLYERPHMFKSQCSVFEWSRRNVRSVFINKSLKRTSLDTSEYLQSLLLFHTRPRKWKSSGKTICIWK